jgi:hypothetical protein
MTVRSTPPAMTMASSTVTVPQEDPPAGEACRTASCPRHKAVRSATSRRCTRAGSAHRHRHRIRDKSRPENRTHRSHAHGRRHKDSCPSPQFDARLACDKARPAPSFTWNGAASSLIETLTRAEMTSAGQLVALDLEAVRLDVSRVPSTNYWNSATNTRPNIGHRPKSFGAVAVARPSRAGPGGWP